MRPLVAIGLATAVTAVGVTGLAIASGRKTSDAAFGPWRLVEHEGTKQQIYKHRSKHVLLGIRLVAVGVDGRNYWHWCVVTPRDGETPDLLIERLKVRLEACSLSTPHGDAPPPSCCADAKTPGDALAQATKEVDEIDLRAPQKDPAKRLLQEIQIVGFAPDGAMYVHEGDRVVVAVVPARVPGSTAFWSVAARVAPGIDLGLSDEPGDLFTAVCEAEGAPLEQFEVTVCTTEGQPTINEALVEALTKYGRLT